MTISRFASLEQRFWDKVDARDVSECWLWTGARNSDGYGSINLGNKTHKMLSAHRVAYALGSGIDVAELDGLVVRHQCDNPPCCNPSHLMAGTPAQNTADALSRGRLYRQFQNDEFCWRGHPLEGNIYVSPKGVRSCRTCNNKRSMAWQKERRSKER